MGRASFTCRFKEPVGRSLSSRRRPGWRLEIPDRGDPQRLDGHFRDDGAREPLRVGRHNVPSRFRRSGLANHLVVGVPVAAPELWRGDDAHGKLPALKSNVQPLLQTAFLLRKQKVTLYDVRRVALKVALEGVDILKPLVPNLLGTNFGRSVASRSW